MKLHRVIILICLSFGLFYQSFSQSTQTGPGVAGHSPGGGGVNIRYLGWDGSVASNSIPLSIEHRGINDIIFSTGAAQRLRINGAFFGPTSGFVGIGGNLSLPASLLHLNGFQNNTGDLFRTTGPDNIVNRWVMAASSPGNPNTDAERFFIENPGVLMNWPNSNFNADIGTNNDGEINFFTNRDTPLIPNDPPLQRSVSIQGGMGDAVHGQVALGNQLPDGFDAHARLHLHKTTDGSGVLGANFVQFTSDYTTGVINAGIFDPDANSGFQVGIQNFSGPNIAHAFVRMWEDQPIRFFTNGEQRMIITSNDGGPTEGYVYIGNQPFPASAPTARLDIDGDLRIRDVQDAGPKHSLILGVQHTPGVGQDLDVRKLDFNGNGGTYLGGNGQWINLPSPSGVNAHNGVSYSTTQPNSIALGQNLNSGSGAELQNDRRIPLNDHNVVFTIMELPQTLVLLTELELAHSLLLHDYT